MPDRTPQALKAALKELGLPVSGVKAELVERLTAAQDAAPATGEAAAAEAAPAEAAPAVAEAPPAEPAPAPAEPTAAVSKEPVPQGKHAKIVFSAPAPAAGPSVSWRAGSPCVRLENGTVRKVPMPPMQPMQPSTYPCHPVHYPSATQYTTPVPRSTYPCRSSTAT
jgi:hypothetical protein